jgi:hypothetical protein
VGPRAGLDDVEKRKFLTLLGLELRPLASLSPYPVAVATALTRPFENTVLRRISNARREEVKRGLQKVHNEVLHNSRYSSRKMRVITGRE